MNSPVFEAESKPTEFANRAWVFCATKADKRPWRKCYPYRVNEQMSEESKAACARLFRQQAEEQIKKFRAEGWHDIVLYHVQGEGTWEDHTILSTEWLG